MKTHAIHSNEQTFPTIVKATAVGSIAGYAAKYMLPLTSDEMDDEFKGAMNIIKIESKKAKAKSIDSIRKIANKTPAQDTFIKMVDVENSEGLTKAGRAGKMKKVLQEAKLSEADKIQLRSIISNVNEKAGEMFQRCAKAYEGAVKRTRHTGAFIAAGAAVGFAAGLIHNILRIDA